MSETTVQPYLFFGGRCEEALEFYRKIAGAEIVMLTRFKEAPETDAMPKMPDCFDEKIMHAVVRIGSSTFFASDGRCEGDPTFEGFSMAINVPSEAEAERIFNALSETGTVIMPLEKTFWASKFGMVEDRFGLGWMVSVAHKT